jgi:ectoine hydroxylase-related dioxygenase (phytanoyl-CoA dioxygenase family)
MLREIDTRGFVVLEGLIDESWLRALRSRFDALAAAEGERGATELKLSAPEAGVTALADLVNKGEVFDGTWGNPLVLALVEHVLRRPFKLSSLNAREPRQGNGNQALHIDGAPRASDAPYAVANSLWVLDGFDEGNGATRVVPGTHLLSGAVGERIADPAAEHPLQTRLICPPGSVVVFNAHLWHGGTVNRSGARRRVIHAYYTARELAQQTDQRAFLQPDTAARLASWQRELLDA